MALNGNVQEFFGLRCFPAALWFIEGVLSVRMAWETQMQGSKFHNSQQQSICDSVSFVPVFAPLRTNAMDFHWCAPLTFKWLTFPAAGWRPGGLGFFLRWRALPKKKIGVRQGRSRFEQRSLEKKRYKIKGYKNRETEKRYFHVDCCWLYSQ